MDVCCQDVEIKEDGARHSLTLFNCRMDMAGSVDFSAANAKSTAHLRVKGDTSSHRIFVKTVTDQTLRNQHLFQPDWLAEREALEGLAPLFSFKGSTQSELHVRL